MFHHNPIYTMQVLHIFAGLDRLLQPADAGGHRRDEDGGLPPLPLPGQGSGQDPGPLQPRHRGHRLPPHLGGDRRALLTLCFQYHYWRLQLQFLQAARSGGISIQAEALHNPYCLMAL